MARRIGAAAHTSPIERGAAPKAVRRLELTLAPLPAMAPMRCRLALMNAHLVELERRVSRPASSRREKDDADLLDQHAFDLQRVCHHVSRTYASARSKPRGYAQERGAAVAADEASWILGVRMGQLRLHRGYLATLLGTEVTRKMPSFDLLSQ